MKTHDLDYSTETKSGLINWFRLQFTNSTEIYFLNQNFAEKYVIMNGSNKKYFCKHYELYQVIRPHMSLEVFSNFQKSLIFFVCHLRIFHYPVSSLEVMLYLYSRSFNSSHWWGFIALFSIYYWARDRLLIDDMLSFTICKKTRKYYNIIKYNVIIEQLK